MEAAIYTTCGLLFVSLMSGLGYLAVKHPATYSMVGYNFLRAVLGFMIFGFGVSVGANLGAQIVHEFVQEDQRSASYAALVSFQNRFALVAIGLILFGLVLWLLAKISVHIYQNERSPSRKNKKSE